MKRLIAIAVVTLAFQAAVRGQELGGLVSYGTNGVVLHPSNFWTANATSILAIVDAPLLVPLSRVVGTSGSLTGGGDLSADRTFSLIGDSSNPGASRYYGTDGSGLRGWYIFPTPEGGGNMHTAIYDTNTNGIVDLADSVAWINVTGRPSTFPPSSHSHPASDISDSSTVGRALLTAGNEAAARTTLQLGNTATLNIGNTAGTVASGDDSRFLSSSQKTDLTDGGDSTSHYHASDRDRANHTGTQARSTISDFAHASTHLPGGADALPWTSIHGEDNLANRPTAGAPNAGYLFRATDNGIIYRSSGVDWIVWFDPGAGGGGGSFNTNDNYSVTGSWNFFGPTFFHGTNDFGELILVNRMEIGEPLELASGGTGATNAAQARVNIGANNASNLDSGTLPAARLPAEAVTETELDSVVSTLQPAHANLDALSSAGSQGTGAFARMSEVGSAAINWDLFESVQTTGDTLTTLAAKPLALDSTAFFKVDVVAAGPTNRAAYELRAVFANLDETGVTLGTNNLVVLESAEAMDAHIVREGTNALLKVRGMPSENIWWLAHGMIFTHTNGLAGEVDEGGGGEDYAVQQGFEGTGYDNGETWVEAGGPDPDYTGVVLAGSQSLRLNQSGAAMSTYIEHATTNEVHGYALIRPVTIDTSNVRIIVGLLQPNGTEVASVRVTTTGGVRVTSGASNGTTSATIANGNTYHVWWRYYTDGADVTVEVWFSTDGTKPSNGSANHATITLAGTTQIARLRLGNASTITQEYIYDNVRVKLGNNPIGSNPE